MPLYEHMTGETLSPVSRNAPLIEAIYFYLEMIRGIRSPHCYSGAVKLYTIQSGGVDMGGLLDDQRPFDVAPKWSLVPADHVRDALVNAPYVGLAITSNIGCYIDTLSALIRSRITALGDTSGQFRHDEIRYVSPTWSFGRNVNLSPLILGRIEDISAKLGNLSNLPDTVAEAERVRLLENLDLVIFAELDRIVKNGGRSNTYPADVSVVPSFLDFITKYMSDRRYPTFGGSRYILNILLNITRLLFGQVAPIAENSDVRAGTTWEKAIRISDETLAMLPMPTKEMIRSFSEPEVPVISRYGALYVAALENVWADRP